MQKEIAQVCLHVFKKAASKCFPQRGNSEKSKLKGQIMENQFLQRPSSLNLKTSLHIAICPKPCFARLLRRRLIWSTPTATLLPKPESSSKGQHKSWKNEEFSYVLLKTCWNNATLVVAKITRVFSSWSYQ